METIHNRRLELLLGILLALAMIAGVVVVWDSFSGDFSDDYTVSAQLSQAGDALGPGDIVTYRDVIVGEVDSASGDLAGGATVKLKIDPASAKVIPADVTAVALPASLFGSTRIDLVPTKTGTGPTLHDGSQIAADRSPAAESLQTALANAYTLLTSVHPAQLDAALTSLGEALQGQGPALGKLVDQADDLLRTLAPHLPQLDAVITSLATVTEHLAKNAPALLDGLSNTLVVAKGILAEKQAVTNLLAVAPTAVANAQLLLNKQNVDNAITVFRDQVPVLAAFGANPDALQKTIAGFKSFADTLGSAMTSGPYLKANIILTGANFASLLDTAAGGKGTAFTAIADPKEYTPAYCPRYPGADGPNCSQAAGKDGSSAQLLETGTDWGGTVGSVGSNQEVFTVSAAATSLTGTTTTIPSTLDLLLGPMLRGTALVIK
jgi:phospholipid/cholesterol/gamma-HCH transport system substrate-binding protein